VIKLQLLRTVALADLEGENKWRANVAKVAADSGKQTRKTFFFCFKDSEMPSGRDRTAHLMARYLEGARLTANHSARAAPQRARRVVGGRTVR